MQSPHPLVQWTFLQYKRTQSQSQSQSQPPQCFLHSATQIGSKILFYGGCDVQGEAQSHLCIYDTASYLWAAPNDSLSLSLSVSDGERDQHQQPGPRYGHSASLVEMHPPRIMIYGGMVGGGTFEFDEPDSAVETLDGSGGTGGMARSFMSSRRKGKRHNTTNSSFEETDDAVYFLTLSADKWRWSKPLIHGGKESKPAARGEHSAVKTGTNEVTIFGGWTDRPTNDMWTFNYVDNEWKMTVSSGIQPRPRYRHTAELVGNRMFILGGSDNGDDIAEDSRNLSIHELRLDTMQWTHPTITGANPFPRSGHASTVLGSKTIGIFGGKRNASTFLNDTILIDLETFVGVTINAVEAHLPTPVANCSLNTVGNKLFVFGGTDIKGNCYNDIRLLDVGYYLSSDDITVNEGASSDYSFKILIIGDAAVGKSALLTRFSDNAFLPHYSTTIGIDFNSRMIRVDKSICKLEIWDTAGQERFSTITANYYRGAQGALLVYDVSERTSFERVKNWYDRAVQLGGEEIEMVLVGNKTDLPLAERQITTDEGEALASELGIPFVETSALNGSNVENAFVTMTRNIKKSVDRRGLTGIKGKNLQQAGGVQLASKEKQSGFTCGCS